MSPRVYVVDLRQEVLVPFLPSRGSGDDDAVRPPRVPFGLGLMSAYGDPDATDLDHVGSEQLEPGDSLLRYTDGVTEARSSQGEMFGIQRLVDLITHSPTAGLPAGETMRRAIRALLAHHGNRLNDGATSLLVQWRPDHPEALLP